MAVTRRKFMQVGALVTMASGLPLKAVAETLDPSISNPKTSLSGALARAGSHFDMQTFSRQLNTYFRLHNETVKDATIKLVEVTDWRTKARKQMGRECFSLIFASDESRSLPQSTYSVEHGSLGSFSMLLVPNGKANRLSYYEAVFNRLR